MTALDIEFESVWLCDVKWSDTKLQEKQRRIERFEQIKEGLEMKRRNEQGTVAVGVRMERKVGKR